MKRKTSETPTRIWKFAANLETETVAREILWRRNRYYNALVEVEQARHARFVAIRATHAPELAALETRWEALDDQISNLYREAKRDRQAHWRETGGDKERLLPPEYETRKQSIEEAKKAVSQSAKPLRAAFAALLAPAREEYKRRTRERADGGGPRTKGRVNAEVLTEMLSEGVWHPAWKEIAKSDTEAHDRMRELRSSSGLYDGTYLDVEAAFARAKQDSSPSPPRFKRFALEGKIQVQMRNGPRWSEIVASKRLRIETLMPRNANPSARSNMRRIVMDQSVGDDRLVVSAICRLHRLPPADAEVKWVSLVVRPHGCQLQITLEHDSFDQPKRPAGNETPVHVALGWARSEGGLRIARLMRGDFEIEAVHCHDNILNQKSHAELVESAADALGVRARRLLRKLLYLRGHRIHWRALETDRNREWLRRRCEDYARHVLGGDEAVLERWRLWREQRNERGEDIYAPLSVLRRTMEPEPALAWWCFLWARKDRHLERLAKDSLRRFANRRDAHYRREAIRIATRFESVTIDNYSIAKLKELEPLTLPGTGVRDLAQWQLHAAAPGRFREILLEVMGPRVTSIERPGDAKTPGTARGRKSKRIQRDPGEASAAE